MWYTTEALLDAAKRSEWFPTSQTTLTDEDLIAFANEELQIKLVPVILSAREDYFISSKVVALKNNLAHYAIPDRAIGNALKDVMYMPDSAVPYTRYPLPRLQVHNIQSRSSVGGIPSGFVVQGDEISLVPIPSGVGQRESLLFFYPERPSQLVSTSSCAKITSVSSDANYITLGVDTDLTQSLAVGGLIDLLSAKSPFRLWSKDVSIVSISGTQIQIALADGSDEAGTIEPQVGDYVCPANKANIIMLPQELHPILSEMICFRALKAAGATEHLQICASNIKDMLSGALKMISNRVESEPDVVYDTEGFISMVNYYGYRSMTR